MSDWSCGVCMFCVERILEESLSGITWGSQNDGPGAGRSLRNPSVEERAETGQGSGEALGVASHVLVRDWGGFEFEVYDSLCCIANGCWAQHPKFFGPYNLRIKPEGQTEDKNPYSYWLRIFVQRSCYCIPTMAWQAK